MAFRWLVSRIVRLLGQKVNSLFYILMYRELQGEIAELAEKLGVQPAELSKEIGKRAANESAARHANILGLVPVNPSNPKKVVQYIETLWYILFGKKLTEYEIEAEERPDGRHRVTFFIKNCPVCMGHEDDGEEYKKLYQLFSGDSEGYACLMAGMLEELARIIMEHKKLDIRMDIKETKCYARGDDIMAVEATVVPAEEYNRRKGIALEITREIEHTSGMGSVGGMEEIANQSTRLFEKIADTLKLDQIDEFFDTPVDSIKDRISEFVEKQLHFTPREILEYFKNYEDDVFRVVGYLVVHALNEAGDIVKQICGNFLLSKVLDIVVSAIEYGLETFLPEKIFEDNQQMVVRMMEDWAVDESVEKFKLMNAKDMFHRVLEGMKLAFMDYGAEFLGAKEATFILLKKSSLMQDKEPTQAFSLLFDIFQEASLLSGYILAIPIKVFLSGSYESVRTPVTSIQEVYKSSRDHFEKLFDLIEQLQDVDFGGSDESLDKQMQKNFPRVF
ncbi:MAG: hypothetical protein ACTSUE_10920 [Promethearchaeota archaeon]